MPTSYLADSSVLVAVVSRNDQRHAWIVGQLPTLPWPWITCEAALTEAFFLTGAAGATRLREMLRRRAVTVNFDLGAEVGPILDLLDKYAAIPMSLADACLVRMSEIQADPVVLTTDSDFRIYRRHSRQVIPCLMP